MRHEVDVGPSVDANHDFRELVDVLVSVRDDCEFESIARFRQLPENGQDFARLIALAFGQVRLERTELDACCRRCAGQ
jgi:hypothetical protein